MRFSSILNALTNICHCEEFDDEAIFRRNIFPLKDCRAPSDSARNDNQITWLKK